MTGRRDLAGRLHGSLAAPTIAVLNSAYTVGTRHPFQTVYVVRVSWFIGRPWYFKPCD
ncbi:hypothetical protein DKAM_0086 [Desulfurococcus amylolyticus 1221n]|uniref:Uncharacterized protein n=1 Tax=Desulfurococcus amylolyticus (strain DSM 18924 / JCM 16383 / VKM B-2413 / 1221n) TaxID=490899 RepID=B8D3E4_DESA1|nr:hypothetical protein DKAM_0086 [Desulfurococcus amylolyticus 1221n]